MLAEGTAIRASFLKNEMDNPLAEGKGGYVFRSILDIQLPMTPTTLAK